MKKLLVLAAIPLVVIVVVAVLVPGASAASVTPTVVSGNPTCVGLGYVYGFKPQPEPPPSGTYTFPDGVNTVTITSVGTYFDWTSTLGIDAVIVKGGPNANVYVYQPPAESFADTVLNAPINPGNNKPYGISHIEFCYDYEVGVTKDAHTSFTRTYTWDIDKSVTPDTWALFTGDSGTSQYTIAVTRTVTDSDFAVNGSIWIYNPDPTNTAYIASVVDDAGGVAATVSCPAMTVAPLATLECTYSAGPLATNTFGATNTATVTTAAASKVGGGSGTAAIDFGSAVVTEVGYPTINVDDSNGGSWEFSDSGSVGYTRTFTCDADEGTHDNTATIRETGQFDDASVTVNCYALGVTKTTDEDFTRTWSWTIDKTGDQTALTLSIGQQFPVNYTVVVDATYTDSAWMVNGKIEVSNPAPMAATLTGVSDLVSPDIAATVSCPSLTVPAGGTLTCTYSADLPDGSNRTNTATATLQNYAYASDGSATASGTTDFSGSADVTFGDPTTEVDECIDVTDDQFGPLGTVCANDVPKTFTYSLYVGPYDVCGEYTFVNVASFVTNDTGTTGSDSWTVTVDVPCAGGCTLTPGYWKTHSEYGPAPYDDTWAQLPTGADTLFFLSGQSYYSVLWTPPTGGNAYYILAHAYIAAKLNVLNGADPAAAQAALNWATTFFSTYTPTSKLSRTVRSDALYYAGILDRYNNGLIGPGHCSE